MDRIELERIRTLAEKLKTSTPMNGCLEGVLVVACLSLLDEIDGKPDRYRQFANAYELPIGTEIVLGKRRWKFVHRMNQHPDIMRFTETTTEEPDPGQRGMYPSEVQWLLDHGCNVTHGS